MTILSNPLPPPLLTGPLKNYLYRHFGVSDFSLLFRFPCFHCFSRNSLLFECFSLLSQRLLGKRQELQSLVFCETRKRRSGQGKPRKKKKRVFLFCHGKGKSHNNKKTRKSDNKKARENSKDFLSNLRGKGLSSFICEEAGRGLPR